MMSLAYIESESRKAAAKSAREGTRPFPVFQQDIDQWKRQFTNGHPPRLPFPFTGNRRFRKWTLVETFFVDSSGMGAEGEAALTARRFVHDSLEAGYGYALVQVGQFQVYVGKFEEK